MQKPEEQAIRSLLVPRAVQRTRARAEGNRKEVSHHVYNAGYDWGKVEEQKFALKQLGGMKQGCEPNCFSTLGYNVA